MENSPATTIEYLRGRLLAERSISKAARQRADELAKRVIELEKQLKIVSLQRKKAEKATADILAILENHGRSDVSEAFDSSSDQEEISSDYKGRKLVEPLENAKVQESEADGFSSSEVESSSISGRSLSWKSSKDSPSRSLDKKYMDASKRRRATFTSTGSSPKRVGKSCRQIRRRENRLAVDGQEKDASTNALHEKEGPSSEGVQNTTIKTVSKDSREDEAERPLEVTSSSGILESHEEGNRQSLNGHKADSDMERALELQEQLIGRYEAEEKAQREWEDKFRENNGVVPDSCDPGTNSDVTEERDEVKAHVPPFSTNVLASQGQDIGVGEVDDNSSGETITSSGFQPSPVESEPLKDPKNKGVINNEGSDNHHYPPESQHTTGKSSQSHVSSSQNGSLLLKGEPSAGKTNHLLVKTHENADHLVSVLEELRLAKLSLEQNLSSQLLGNRPPVPTYRPEDKFALPFSSAGLFRLPTDYQYGDATKTAIRLGSDSRFSLTSRSNDPTSNLLLSSPYGESPSRSATPLDDRFHTSPYQDFGPLAFEPRSVEPFAFDPRLHMEPFGFNPRLAAGPSALDPRLTMGSSPAQRPLGFDPRLDVELLGSDPRLAATPSASNPRMTAGPSSSYGRSASDPRLTAGSSSSYARSVSDPRLTAGSSSSYARSASDQRLTAGSSSSYARSASDSRLAAATSASDPRFAMGSPLASDRNPRGFGHSQWRGSMPSSSSSTYNHVYNDGRIPDSLPGGDAGIPPTRMPLYENRTRARPNMYR